MQVSFMRWAKSSEVQWDKPVHVPREALKAAAWISKRTHAEIESAQQQALQKICALGEKLHQSGAVEDWWHGVDATVVR